MERNFEPRKGDLIKATFPLGGEGASYHVSIVDIFDEESEEARKFKEICQPPQDVQEGDSFDRESKCRLIRIRELGDKQRVLDIWEGDIRKGMFGIMEFEKVEPTEE